MRGVGVVELEEADLARRPETDPAKVALAARLRMGTRNTLDTKLKQWRKKQ